MTGGSQRRIRRNHRLVAFFALPTVAFFTLSFLAFHLNAENNGIDPNTRGTAFSGSVSGKPSLSRPLGHRATHSSGFALLGDNINASSASEAPYYLRRVPSVHPANFSKYWRSVATLSSPQQPHVATTSHCVSVGMQEKCYFRNLVVENNRFFVTGTKQELQGMQRYPNPIYPADGQVGPLKKYHQYSGHHIRQLVEGGLDHQCAYVVSRPTVFLFRMSGHSTYHLWENNLGPFFSTLQQPFGPNSNVNNEGKSVNLQAALNDPKQLLVSFVDSKPTSGPKAPRLLDKLLRTFTDRPLLNASKITNRTCFAHAVVGIADSSFPHRRLLNRVMDNVVGYSPPLPLPPFPTKVLFVSRNHHSVVRGRKIRNEEEAVRALNATLLQLSNGASSLSRVFMEDFVFEDQIRLAMATHMMFSPHGGGVANCIWMREGGVVVEFVAPVGKTLLNMYHSMCKKSGVSHVSFLADPDPDDAGKDLSGNPRLFSNMLLPVSTLLAQAESAMALYRRNYESQEAQRK